MASWARLQKLNGGKKIWYVAPPLDEKSEVWFYAPDNELRVHSRGKLAITERVIAREPVTARHTLYKVAEQLFVDVEVRGARAVLRRGLLNGAHVVTAIAPGDVDGWLVHYRGLGFRDCSPWHATKTRVTRREYRARAKKWWIEVDGNAVDVDGKEAMQRSRDAAIAHAEARIREREKSGFALTLIELMKAAHDNPAPTAPARVAKRPAFAKPKDAYAAVDGAIAMLADLHARFAKHHFVAELVDPKAERARILELEGDYFLRIHKRRIGAWRGVKPGKPVRGESSWSYFQRVYGSITWCLSSEADQDLSMFYCGNVSGGGWSCLEVADDLYDTAELAKIMKVPDLAKLHVFHGGWHTGHGFAFDERVATKTNEHLIVPFDEGEPALAKSANVVPFGMWLWKRVDKLTRIAERNLREL